MKLTSKDFVNGGNIPIEFTCDSKDVSPQLSWDGVPEEAIQVTNDFGKKDYGGPCPPSGTHRYYFSVHALSTKTLEGVNRYNFFDKVNEHTLEKAEIMGLYQRQR